MRHIAAIIFSVVAFLATTSLQAQQIQQVHSVQDTAQVVVQRPPLADSTLVGVTVFQYVEGAGEGNITLNQPSQMEQGYAKYVGSNKDKKRNGYRIRLFFDNKQSARVESEELEKAFQQQFPLIPTYRSYTNPFFKLVVGDYRTKSDAIKELQKILPFYPQAIVVKESIYFPAI